MRLDRRRDLLEQHALAGEVTERVEPDEPLDPPDAGADRGLAQQLDHAELRRARGVRAAAELARVGRRSPTSTTRTASPYFSPNSAIAPIRRASSSVVTNALTARSRSSTSLTSSSTSRTTDPGTADGEGKSKRSRPGALSEPAWVAVSPSASRSARWTQVRRGVGARDGSAGATVDLRVDARRRRSARRRSPEPRCTTRPVTGRCTSNTSAAPPSKTKRPWSLSWPPDSA